jgi:hypothetical protein
MPRVMVGVLVPTKVEAERKIRDDDVLDRILQSDIDQRKITLSKFEGSVQIVEVVIGGDFHGLKIINNFDLQKLSMTQEPASDDEIWLAERIAEVYQDYTDRMKLKEAYRGK